MCNSERQGLPLSLILALNVSRPKQMVTLFIWEFARPMASRQVIGKLPSKNIDLPQDLSQSICSLVLKYRGLIMLLVGYITLQSWSHRRTPETHPKHLPEVGVPEAERDIRDVQPFWGGFTLWVFTALRLWLLAVCLCSSFRLLRKEINSKQK